MTTLRLLADDLTGALDTAAEFVPLVGPVQAFWHGAIPRALPPNAAIDSCTRERGGAQDAATILPLLDHLSGADIAYKKIDSLLRGPTLAELAACFRHGGWSRAVLAPAFPYQGRVTRDGRQFTRDGEGRWSAIGGDLVLELAAAGIAAQRGAPDVDLPPGVTVFDAETDDDLRRVVQTARRTPGPLLWCGSGGLAQALAQDAPPAIPPQLAPPILGLFGSDQAVTAAQLAACAPHWIRLPDGDASLLRSQLDRNGKVLASLDLPPGLTRAAAASRIAADFARLVHDLPAPGTLLVAGGETLRALCLSLGADSLEVQSRLMPGVPYAVLRGGRWNSVAVVAKSGAFGHPALLRDLLLDAERALEGTH